LLAGEPFPAGLRFAGVALPLLALAGVLAGVLDPLAGWPIATGLDTPAAFAAAALGNSKLPLRRKTLTGAGTGWGGGWGTSLQHDDSSSSSSSSSTTHDTINDTLCSTMSCIRQIITAYSHAQI
jgi:hypothetical protein